MKINYKSLFPLYGNAYTGDCIWPSPRSQPFFFHCCHMTCGVARYQEQVMYHLYIYIAANFTCTFAVLGLKIRESWLDNYLDLQEKTVLNRKLQRLVIFDTFERNVWQRFGSACNHHVCARFLAGSRDSGPADSVCNETVPFVYKIFQVFPMSLLRNCAGFIFRRPAH